MKLSLIIISTLLLSGCYSIPQKPKFPDPPGSESMTICPELNKLSGDSKLSDISKTITKNYTLYHQCNTKVQGWIDWYNVQKQIYEGKK